MRKISGVVRAFSTNLFISYTVFSHLCPWNINIRLYYWVGHGMVMSHIHQAWPKSSCKAQWKGKEDKADRGRGGKTTSENGQALSLPSPKGQWRTGKNGGNWLRNHLWCPNDPRAKGINEMRERQCRYCHIRYRHGLSTGSHWQYRYCHGQYEHSHS